jgi:transposase
MLTRYREQLMGDRTRETVRLELMLEDASIKLSVHRRPSARKECH